MTAEPDRFIKHGVKTDITLTLGFQDGLFFGVRIDEKDGTLLDEFQFKIDKVTVSRWIKSMLFK